MKSQDAVHGFRQIESDIKANVFADINVVLLHGRENFLTESYEKRLSALFIAPEAAVMDEMRFDEDSSADDVIAACDTLPMFSARRVVVITNFAGDEKSLASSDAKALAGFLPRIPEQTLLIICSDGVSKRSALYKSIVERGRAYEFDRLERSDLKAFIKGRFRNAGFAVGEDVIAEIITASGYLDRDSDCDLFRLSGELKRIAAYAASKEIRHADVAACMETSPETDVFALLDAVSSGKKGEALELAAGIAAKEENSFQLLGLLTSQFELMLGCREMQEKAASYKDMMKTLGVNSEFRLKKAAGYASRYSVPRLMELLSRLYRVETDIKSGLYHERLAVTMFIAEM